MTLVKFKIEFETQEYQTKIPRKRTKESICLFNIGERGDSIYALERCERMPCLSDHN